MIIATDDNTGNILGQLLIELNFGDIGLIQKWQPIVLPIINRMEVATALIEKSKEIIKSHSKSKMEIWMELADEHAQSMSVMYRNWYERCGFQLTSDEYNMEATHADLSRISYSIPKQIEVATMNSVPFKKLRDAVFEAFKDSKDQWVINQTEDEIRSIIRSWMKVEEVLHPCASIVFIENGKIIAFNGMQIQEDSVEVGPLGVIPSHRGKKLGRLLLLESVKRFQVKEIKKVILSVSTKNQPAIKIYSKLGFQTQFQTLIYSWNPDKKKNR
jgi:ribosomal protein S18 acetylase RimI-like enzyme